MDTVAEPMPPAQKPPSLVASAPWKALLSQNIQQTGQNDSTSLPEFHLATITPSGQPRLRTLYHRSFWGERASLFNTNNSPLYESDCPTFVTGARSNKGRDIYAAGLDGCRSPTGSGGGAEVEILYWFRDLGIQWRIRGRCWLISSEDSPRPHASWSSIDQGAQLTRQAIYPYVRMVKDPAAAFTKERRVKQVEAYIAETAEGVFWRWDKEVESYAAELDAEQRKEFERAGFRVGIILPEAVELRDQMQNSKKLWALSEVETDEAVCQREWIVVKVWP